MRALDPRIHACASPPVGLIRTALAARLHGLPGQARQWRPL